MSPTTLPKTQTSAGMETVDQTVARAQQMVPQTGLATSRAPSQLKIDVPPIIPAATLSSDATISDAFAKRGELEQQAMATGQLSTDYQNLFTRIGDLSSTPLSNPDQFINRLLLNQPTETQQALDAQRGTQAETIRGFAGELSQTGTQAREQFGVQGLQENLANTRNQIAERTVKLRETIRDFETNAERRGVAREFVESEKQKVQADAVAELADLAIIEQAQLGNLNEARAEVDTILAEKRQAFEYENAAIEAEIARLEQMDTREADIRKEQLQIALTERNRNIETALANEKEQRGYLVEAAANGADQGTLDAIRRATSPAQAALLASPFIGRLDRMQAEASIRSSNATADRAETGRLLDLAEAGNPEAIAALNLTLPDGKQPTTDLIAYAQQYAATGKIPTGMPKDLKFGDVASYAKDLPKPTGTIVNTNTGVADTSLGADEQADMKRLYNIVQMTEKLKALDKERATGLVGGTLGKVFGSEKQATYLATRKAIVDEIARMQTGAALTNDEQAFYNDYLPGRFTETFFLGTDSQEKIENFATLMNDKLNNTLSNNSLTIYGYSQVDLGGQPYTVGDVVTNSNSQQGIVNADGTITVINQ